MDFLPLAIPDVMLIKHRLYTDERGSFMELFRQQDFTARCGEMNFVQDNLSRSCQGTLRGLHYQIVRPQGKLVQVISGTIFDVAVDLRRNSPTCGQWVGQHLDADTPMSLWIPPGFAHGFYVTTESAEFVYKCTNYYNPSAEHSIRWNDPDLNIQWPLVDGQQPSLSAKDAEGKLFKDAVYFD